MIHLDAIWNVPRYVSISGQERRVPFGVDLPLNLVNFIRDWIERSGPSWTAGRCKELSVWATHVLSGNKEYSSPWFRTIRYEGFKIPKLKIFEDLVTNRNHPKRIVLIMTVLKSYRLKTWGRPSLSSVVDTLTSRDPGEYIPLLRKYVTLPYVPNHVLESTLMVNTTSSYADDFGRTFPGPYGLFDTDLPEKVKFLAEDLNSKVYSLGRLMPIPDKGKWRNVLVGHFALQLKTKKLADWLRRYLWTLPEVASKDQTKFEDFVIANQKVGKMILSIDLSQATDRLSREFQVQLLESMGVPKGYFDFLNLPATIDRSDYDKSMDSEKEEVWYSNGQPMGLYVSFPMFELMHYVFLKFVVSTTDANFVICGDDVAIACDRGDSNVLFTRYTNLIERFGGVISATKTIQSNRLAEGVGALFLRGHQKPIRIPSGKLSVLEALTPGMWLNQSIRDADVVGRSIHASWLSAKEKRRYTHQHRRAINEAMMLKDFSALTKDGLRTLSEHEAIPMEWYIWDDVPPGTRMDNPLFPCGEDSDDIPAVYPQPLKEESGLTYRYRPLKEYLDILVTHKIVGLYKKDKENEFKKTEI